MNVKPIAFFLLFITSFSLNIIGIGAIDKFRLAVPRKSSPENEYILRSNPAIDQWTYTVGASLKRLISNGYINVAVNRNMFNNRANQFEDNNPSSVQTLNLNSDEIENKLRIDVNKYANGWRFSYGADVQFVKYNRDLGGKNLLAAVEPCAFIPRNKMRLLLVRS